MIYIYKYVTGLLYMQTLVLKDTEILLKVEAYKLFFCDRYKTPI